MGCTVVYACDVCGESVIHDASDDAACNFTRRLIYPAGWYVGDEEVACSKTACQAAVMRSEHDLPADYDPTGDGL